MPAQSTDEVGSFLHLGTLVDWRAIAFGIVIRASDRNWAIILRPGYVIWVAASGMENVIY